MGAVGFDVRTLESLLEESQSHLPQTERTAINRDLSGLIQQTSELSAALQIPYRHELRMDAVLAARGFDNERHRRTLQGAMASRVFCEPPQAVHAVDLEGFLQHRHHVILLTAIEEAKKKTLESHDAAYSKALDAEWAQAKKDLEGLLGQRRGHVGAPQALPAPELPALAAPAAPQAMPALPWLPPGAGPPPTVMDNRMEAYAQQVRELSAAYSRQEELGAPVRRFIDGCARVAQGAPATVERQRLVAECWEIIQSLTEDAHRPLTGMAVALEGPDAPRLRLVHAARACLEAQYAKYMAARLAERGYRAEMPRRQVIDQFRQQAEAGHWGNAAWGNLYYSLRSGAYPTALEFADEAGGLVPGVVREELRKYVQAPNRQTFQASAGMQEYWRDLQTRWASEPHLACDPFEVATYLLLLRGEFHKALHPLIRTCQDYLWFKLCYVRSIGDSDAAADPQTLRAVQAQLLAESSGGLKQQTADRLLWFKALLYVNLFGPAIHHLMTEIDGFQVEAVHFALALHAAKLLPITPKVDDPLLVQDRVNLYLIVHEYCKFVAPTNAREAIAYYNVLAPDDEPAADALIINLAVDQGFHAEMFPSSEVLDPYGTAGTVELTLGHERTRRLTAAAAERAHQLGRYPAMVDMYLVAVRLSRGQEDELREYANAVLEEVNNLLAGVLQVGTPNRAEYLVLAQKVDHVLKSLNVFRQVDLMSSRYATFQLLLGLAEFFQCVRDQADERALQIAEDCDLLPRGVSDLQNKVRAFREAVDGSVKRDFAAFVAHFLHLLSRRQQRLRLEGVHGAEVLNIKERAQCVMNFVGQSGMVMSMDLQKRLMDLHAAIAL